MKTFELSAMLWKELREIHSEMIRGRGRFQMLMLIAAGCIIGLTGGENTSGFTAAAMVPFLAMFSVILVVVDAFAGERERHTLDTLLASRLSESAILLGKYLAVVVYGVATGVVLLAANLTVQRLRGGAVTIEPKLVGVALGGSLLTSSAAGALGLLLSLRASAVKQTQQLLAFCIMIPSLGLLTLWGALEPGTRAQIERSVGGFSPAGIFGVIAALLLTATAVLLAIARIRFKRNKLVAG